MKSSLISRAAVGAGALLVAVALAGCDDETDPPKAIESSSEPTSAPTSATTEPTPTGPAEPTLPPEAKENTKPGAEAFLDFYWEAVNFAQRTGNAELLRSLSIEGCVGCNGGIESIERIYRRGGQIIGGANRVVESELLPKPSGGWVATQAVHVGRQQIRGAGNLDQTSEAGRVELLLGVTFQAGAWVVTSLEV